MTCRRIVDGVLVGALLFAGTEVNSARADNSHGYWYRHSIVMRAAAANWPLGSKRTRFQEAVDRFNQNPSDFRIVQQWGDTSVAVDNGQNEVWVSSNSTHLDGAPAVTIYQYAFGWPLFTDELVEADVLINSKEAYTYSKSRSQLWSFGGPYRPFQTTLLHEYGHVAGLSHEADEYNIMGQDWTHIHCNGETAECYLGEDAAEGLIKIYGSRAAEDIQDVSVSIFKYVGRSGAYSMHDFCEVKNEAQVRLPAINDPIEQPIFWVRTGDTNKYEFVFENNGENTQTIKVGFYLSEDSKIDLADRRIATHQFTLARGNVDKKEKRLRLDPSWVVPGKTYYIGAIVDYDNQVAEVDEVNNAAYHIVYIMQ